MHILKVIILLIFFIPLELLAGEDFSISGNIEVLKKGGKKPLSSFDNVAVYLRGVTVPAEHPAVIVKQKNKQFEPRILPIVKGQTVHFYNYDNLDHNVFSPSKSEPFDLGHYPINDFREQRFNQLGRHKVYCNIHKSMILDILVLDNPYFTTTDKQGHFEIKNVPTGNYTLKSWHIYGGSNTIDITVDGDTQLDVQTITSARVVRQLENHLNKKGRPYRKTRYGR